MKNQQKGKPKWLRKLEQESWQAELIISGVAIYGSLQLPDLIDELAGWTIGLLSTSANFMLNLFFTYSLFAAYTLILAFIFHFVLRTLWIGMVGLNSVFPEGINFERSKYSPHFTRQLKEKLSFGNDPIHQLDELSSLVFSFCANTVMVFMAINIDVLVGFGIWTILGNIFSEEIATLVIKFLLVSFTVISLISLILNAEKLRDTPFAKRWQFPLFVVSSKMALHIFYRPINLLTYTFTTNIDLRKYYLWSILIMVVLMVFTVVDLVNSDAVYFGRKDSLELTFNRADRMLSENYENLRQPDDGYILSALIEADRFSGPSMRVFVPVFNNEEETQDKLCGEFEKLDGMDRDEARLLRRDFQLKCLEKVHRFYINDSLYQTTLFFYKHENKDENGVTTYLPTDDFKKGENILKVEKWSVDTVYRTMQIPFIFE